MQLKNNLPKRILHVLINTNRGGAETFIMNIYRNIDRSKVQFDFIKHINESGAYDDEIKSLGGKIISVSNPFKYKKISLRKYFKYIKEIKDIFKRNNYETIHTHISGRATPLLRIAKKMGVRNRFSHSHIAFRGFSIKSIFYKIYGWPIRFYATKLLACSRLAAESMYGKRLVKRNKVILINNAIDAKKFSFDLNLRDEFRKKMSLEKKKVIANVSRFSYQKNHEFMIDIIADLIKIDKDYRLVLVGTGDLKSNIRNKANELGLLNYVKFLGVRSDISKILNAFDLFLMPSRYEGLPLTIIEAQCNGLKCLISDTVTDEVKITDLVYYQSLRENPSKWAEYVNFLFNIKLTKKREEYYKEVILSDYDVKKNAKYLQDFYLKN